MMVRNLIVFLLMVVALAACTKEQVAPAGEVLTGEDKRLQQGPNEADHGSTSILKEEPQSSEGILRSGDLDEQGGEDDGDISDDGDEDADGERNKKKNIGSSGN
ncbi:MAG: hypothetical protein IPM49_10120 [Flavobacteriales bacterium]|nr:hypothetical protein [Flavobacteriales bacterium]